MHWPWALAGPSSEKQGPVSQPGQRERGLGSQHSCRRAQAEEGDTEPRQGGAGGAAPLAHRPIPAGLLLKKRSDFPEPVNLKALSCARDPSSSCCKMPAPFPNLSPKEILGLTRVVSRSDNSVSGSAGNQSTPRTCVLVVLQSSQKAPAPFRWVLRMPARCQRAGDADGAPTCVRFG